MREVFVYFKSRPSGGRYLKLNRMMSSIGFKGRNQDLAFWKRVSEKSKTSMKKLYQPRTSAGSKFSSLKTSLFGGSRSNLAWTESSHFFLEDNPRVTVTYSDYVDPHDPLSRQDQSFRYTSASSVLGDDKFLSKGDAGSALGRRISALPRISKVNPAHRDMDADSPQFAFPEKISGPKRLLPVKDLSFISRFRNDYKELDSYKCVFKDEFVNPKLIEHPNPVHDVTKSNPYIVEKPQFQSYQNSNRNIDGRSQLQSSSNHLNCTKSRESFETQSLPGLISFIPNVETPEVLAEVGTDHLVGDGPRRMAYSEAHRPLRKKLCHRTHHLDPMNSMHSFKFRIATITDDKGNEIGEIVDHVLKVNNV